MKQILFRDEMVHAILFGRKTQTRRPITRLNKIGKISEFGRSDTIGYDWHCRDKHMRWHDLRNENLLCRCPYGLCGDNLLVREQWRTIKEYDKLSPSELEEDVPVQYKTDGAMNYNAIDKVFGRWRSSMYMPSWMSRITLDIIDVRVERLNDISGEDAIKEGIDGCSYSCSTREPGWKDYFGGERFIDPRESFKSLWNSINKPRGHGWNTNPWVWVLVFRKKSKYGIQRGTPVNEIEVDVRSLPRLKPHVFLTRRDIEDEDV